MNPLSVGNVVSAGLRIYRDNFVKYFKLAFIGYLWILIPIYGWAKYSAMTGLLARLAYGEVREKPESVRDAQRHIKPKTWDFFAMGFLVSLIIFSAIIGFVFVFSLVSVFSGYILSQNPGGALSAVAILLIVAALILLIFSLIWLISRLFLVEIPLAIEEGASSAGTIGRSWQLTKSSVGRVQLVLLLGFLVTLPMGIVINIISAIFQYFINSMVNAAGSMTRLGFITTVIYVLFLFATSALIVPFWQAVKAVVYYDLLIRKEGMGFDLRK